VSDKLEADVEIKTIASGQREIAIDGDLQITVADQKEARAFINAFKEEHPGITLSIEYTGEDRRDKQHRVIFTKHMKNGKHIEMPEMLCRHIGSMAARLYHESDEIKNVTSFVIREAEDS